jgi:hypothetical protein
MTKQKQETEKSKSGSALPPGLAASSRQRTIDAAAKVVKAMAAIELDIEKHDGIYPFNKGAVNQSEVCRRAGISKQTLQNPTHRESTRAAIDNWLRELSGKRITGSKNVRREVTNRADKWKNAHTQVATKYHIANLDLKNANTELKEARARIDELEKIVEALREQIASHPTSNLRSLPRKKK